MAKRKTHISKVSVVLGEGHEQLLEEAALVSGKTAHVFRTLSGYAPPLIWGPEVVVASHIGVVTFDISYEAVGDTLVLARVTYFKGKDAGKQVTEEFKDDTVITTSNSVATVRCQFKGIPTGSAVNITCDP